MQQNQQDTLSAASEMRTEKYRFYHVNKYYVINQISQQRSSYEHKKHKQTGSRITK